VTTCQRSLASSDNPDDTNLLRQARLFTIAPFDQDPANWKLFGWDRVHAIVVLSADAEKRAADQLARLSALPRASSSLHAYDREIDSAQNPLGDFRYLDNGERAAYVARLSTERQALQPSPIENGNSTGQVPSVSSENTNANPLGVLFMLGIAAAMANHSNASSQSSDDAPPTFQAPQENMILEDEARQVDQEDEDEAARQQKQNDEAAAAAQEQMHEQQEEQMQEYYSARGLDQNGQ
jgi:hypothetical protein